MRLPTSWRRPVPNREPLYTLPEIADRLGMEHDSLMRVLREHKWADAPKAAYKPPTHAISQKKMYLLSDFKKWVIDRTTPQEK
jgi:hypothetical protein